MDKTPLERQFKCYICEKHFLKSNLLDFHLKNTHESLAKFKCELCGKEYKAKVNLERHKQNHHGESTKVESIENYHQ